MLAVENVDVWGVDHAVRGMRNPLNSWDKSDTIKAVRYTQHEEGVVLEIGFSVGSNDLELMKKLYNAGPEHRKYLRQIFVSMDITAPLYWWKEFDTYKVGTVANSCSTMHTIHKKEFTLDDFSTEHLDSYCKDCLEHVIMILNMYRNIYLRENKKDDWWQMIQMLPTSYNQKRTVTMNYENVVSIIHQRSGHKLDEWHDLIDVFMKLPVVGDLING